MEGSRKQRVFFNDRCMSGVVMRMYRHLEEDSLLGGRVEATSLANSASTQK